MPDAMMTVTKQFEVLEMIAATRAQRTDMVDVEKATFRAPLPVRMPVRTPPLILEVEPMPDGAGDRFANPAQAECRF